ncbi:hypothetical protein [Jiella pelagia]|uniref:Short chain dehydrogenase n=1 Tax=Jiella pelagia TaxID=2986949 RepID=A0ABY7BY70_9HYPH|nr:hypothetical protein [Jiella pelagia]WAP68363.1 hypothetical protein OH818_24020 [Jiella pelagia]
MTNHPSLDGRVVIVTGGARGLGREMALEPRRTGRPPRHHRRRGNAGAA